MEITQEHQGEKMKEIEKVVLELLFCDFVSCLIS